MRYLVLGIAFFTIASCGEGRPGSVSTPGRLLVGAGVDANPSGAFQARLGVYPLNVNVAEPLVRLTPALKVEPLLATRWDFRGSNTWRFTLRQGVMFHDGQPLTAGAVKESLLQVVKARLGYSFLEEGSFAIVNDSTIDITPTQPNLRLPEQLVHPNYSIFAPKTEPGIRPIGTGPFRFVGYEPRNRISVVRNESYWGTPALLDRITFRFYPDPTTRVLALAAGEVDLVMDLPREQVRSFTRRSGFRVERAPVGLILALQVNSHGTGLYDLLTDRALRQAVGLSIDRERLVGRVWEGEAEAVQNMTVPAVLGRFSGLVRGFPHDPGRAAAILDSAGWPQGPDQIRSRKGRRLRLVLLANPETDPGTVEFIQAELRKVGVEVAWPRLPDIGSYAARLNRGEFDLNLSLSNQNDANPLFLPALIFYSGSTRPFARWHLVGEKFDRLVEAGMRATNPDEAQRLAAEAIHIAVDEEAVLIPIAALFRLYAMKTTVEGFSPHPSSTNQLWTRVVIK
ncbi:MAG: ABC transporter substrate-binding protein [Gemmatimonadales bacterium]